MEHHLLPKFGSCTLGSFTRDQFQDYLDELAASGLSFSTVDHVRWDLKQIFDMAVAEGFLLRNPALLIFTLLVPVIFYDQRYILDLGILVDPVMRESRKQLAVVASGVVVIGVGAGLVFVAFLAGPLRRLRAGV